MYKTHTTHIDTNTHTHTHTHTDTHRHTQTHTHTQTQTQTDTHTHTYIQVPPNDFGPLISSAQEVLARNPHTYWGSTCQRRPLRRGTCACSVAASYKPPMLVTRVRLPACAFSIHRPVFGFPSGRPGLFKIAERGFDPRTFGL